MIRLCCDCQKTIKLSADHMGRAVACPACRTHLRVVGRADSSAEGALSLHLRVQSGPQRVGERIFPSGAWPIRIGKARDVPMRLVGDAVSRKHCELRRDHARWAVQDLQSTNGLFVNGNRVERAVLAVGDEIRVGSYVLQVLDSAGPGAVDAGAAGRTLAADTGATEALSSLDEEAALQTTTLGHDAPGGPPPVPPPIPPPIPIPAAEKDDGGLFELEELEDTAPAARPSDFSRPCPDCQTPIAAHARICVNCGHDKYTGKQIPLDADGRPATQTPGLGVFLRDCLWSLVGFTEAGDLVQFIVCVVLGAMMGAVASLGCFALPARLILGGILASFYIAVLEDAAQGKKDLPQFGAMEDGWVDAFVAPIVKFAVAWGIVLMPAVIYFAGSDTVNPDATFYVLAGVGAFFWPMVILGLVLAGYGALFRPDLMVLAVIKAFLPYLVTAVLVGGVLFAFAMLQELATSSSGSLFGGSTYMLQIVLSATGVYVMIVAMRCTGLFYYHFKSRLPFSWG